MKRKVFIATIMTVLFCISGCESRREPMPELSSEYYVGITYGGSGYGTYNDCFQGVAIVCTNKDLLVYMPKDKSSEYVVADTLKLTDAQYDGIVKSVDRKKLYYLYANEQIEEGDGDSCIASIMLYNGNNELLIDCGGYKPNNEYFNSAYRALYEYLPMEELDKIRSDWANKLIEE